jgi:hypothetical protein
MDDSVRLQKVIGATQGLKPSYFPTSRIIPNGSGSGPWLSEPKKSYVYNIDFTLTPSKDQEGSAIAKGLDNIQNSSMVLQFSTPTAEPYILYCSFLYNLAIRTESGNAEFVF